MSEAAVVAVVMMGTCGNKVLIEIVVALVRSATLVNTDRNTPPAEAG